MSGGFDLFLQSNLRDAENRLSATLGSMSVKIAGLHAQLTEQARQASLEAVRAATPVGIGESADDAPHLRDTTVVDVVASSDGTESSLRVRQTKMVYLRKEGIDYPLAFLLIQGTDAHDIRPIPASDGGSKKALMWVGAPGGHPWGKVTIPAHEGYDYVTPAMDAVSASLAAIFQREVSLAHLLGGGNA